MSGDQRRIIEMHPSNYKYNKYENIYPRVDQVWDPNSHLRNTDEARCLALEESIRNNGYDYAPNMIKV